MIELVKAEVAAGRAMYCLGPNCGVILTHSAGCNWVKCVLLSLLLPSSFYHPLVPTIHLPFLLSTSLSSVVWPRGARL